ncbi:hypothetical protein [uncultured Aureimonas sp.]|uniref:hypothetical protein n=1 Tax=uncultured Aureimonas sp. TaxID=1604662 RepID=UPI0025EE6D09|nr:hypothetical protein [uncultured Aureimonas sp.]
MDDLLDHGSEDVKALAWNDDQSQCPIAEGLLMRHVTIAGQKYGATLRLHRREKVPILEPFPTRRKRFD